MTRGIRNDGQPRVPRQSRSLRLNPYQRDVLVGAVTTEVNRVRTENSVPKSLKILAVKELNEILVQLEAIPGMDNEES